MSNPNTNEIPNPLDHQSTHPNNPDPDHHHQPQPQQHIPSSSSTATPQMSHHHHPSPPNETNHNDFDADADADADADVDTDNHNTSTRTPTERIKSPPPLPNNTETDDEDESEAPKASAEDEDEDEDEKKARTHLNTELDPFPWADLEARFVAQMEECAREEAGIGEEFAGWVELFKVWAHETGGREGERESKRLRTRITSVQNAEEVVEGKRLHYIKVVQAFESALALLGSV